jgi:NADH dehydrogenase FAD-containing subunit
MPALQRRSKSSFSRRSAIKKSFHQEQVLDDPTVAVIGGGASGIAYASARGVRAVVFDTV